MTNTTPIRAATAILLLMSLSASASGAAREDTLLGRYWFPERDGQFEIYLKEGRYFGEVISFDKPDQRDEKNADASLRSRHFVGIDMFAGFHFDASESKWIGGTIYDPKSGKTYNCNLWFEANEPNSLRARGYIGFSFLGRTETFDRVTATP